ncbi:MAG: hypothetical protein AAFY01_01605 [Pseudomonadota bacterium]
MAGLKATAMQYGGKKYGYIRGSDVGRDGMYIEVADHLKPAEPIIEVFYSDETHKMHVTLFEKDVPLELLQWAISIAQEQLPPRA